MHKKSMGTISRRSLLKKGIALLAGIATFPLLANFRYPLAAGKLAKADVRMADRFSRRHRGK